MDQVIQWELTDHRVGYLGKHRDETYAALDEVYGKDRWRFVWLVGGRGIDFLGACALYEDAYFHFLSSNSAVLRQLIHDASNVYDDSESNVESGLDYSHQESNCTHIQDIAIRRCLVRMCKWFEGDKLIRVRQSKGDHPLSMTLSPGKVPFHRAELILVPFLIEVWWDRWSIEDFYQLNRFIQVAKIIEPKSLDEKDLEKVSEDFDKYLEEHQDELAARLKSREEAARRIAPTESTLESGYAEDI